MRIVDIEHLCGGEIIAKDITYTNGTVLLKQHTRYRPGFKDKLLELNIPFVYIEDELSEGIEPEVLVSNERKAILTKEFSEEANKIKANTTIEVANIRKMVESLIDEISGKNIMYDIMDIKRNDADVYEHSIGVAIIALLLCKKMNLNIDLTRDIVIGALLHDVGKILIPKEILEKKEKLNEKEQELIWEHPQMGYNIIKDNPDISAVTKVVVLCHHEREDGSGYPLGKGSDLHIGAKIVACCDVFNALTSSRGYRQGMELNEVVVQLRTERLNLEVRTALESILAFYPVGTCVLLSNGAVGIVEKNYQGNLKRPLVRIVKDGNTFLDSTYRMDLSQESRVFIAQRLGNIS
jgi:putative nucleotidyltransferase with HDIG domain